MTGLQQVEPTQPLAAAGVLARLARAANSRPVYIAIGLLLLVFVALAVHTYLSVKRELTDVVMARRLAIAQLAAATQSERLDRMVDLALSLATRVRFADLVAAGDWDAAVQILRGVPAEFRFVDRLFLSDIQGTVKADVPALQGARGKNLAEADWYQGVSRSGKPYVSGVYLRAAPPGREVFAVAAPIVGSDARRAGILVIQIRPEAFFDWAQEIDLGPGGGMIVVDREGREVFNKLARTKTQIVDLSASPAVAQLLRGQSGVAIAADPAERAEHLYAFVPTRHGWGVVAHQPLAQAFAARESQLTRLLVGYGIILLFFVSTVLLGSRIAVERRRAGERGAQLQAVADTAHDAIVSADQHGRIMYFNRGAERLFGYTADEIRGQPLTRLMPERFHEPHRAGFARFIATGEARVIGKTVELAAIKRDRSEIPVELSIADWTAGGQQFFTAILRDITARKKAERRLAERLRILHEIDRAVAAEEAPEAIAAAVIQPLRELLGVPRAIVNKFDLAAGEAEWVAAAGRRQTRVGPGVRYPIGFMGDIEALRRGEPQRIDVHALPAGPEADALLASGVHVYMAVPMIAGGELIGALSFGGAGDVFPPEQIGIAQETATQLAIAMAQARLLERVKRHADELESRVRERTAALDAVNHDLEDLYNNAPCGYHSVNKDGVIVRMNDTELRWLGYTRDQVIGRMPVQQLHTPQSLERFKSRFETFKQTGVSRDAEYEFKRKDGSTLSVLLNATALRDDSGNFVMSRSTIFDITERKQADERVRALNKELESFSYSVSHDLRAPLRAVDGYARMLEEDYGGRLDEEGRRLLAVVRDSAKKMGQLIDDLLAFSRLGRQDPVKRQVDMTALANEAVDELARGARTGIELAELPPAEADRALLKQVWTNLIGNALKYSGKREAPRIEVGGRRDAAETVYWVRDNGVGFDMRYVEKLFGVFQRLHGADEFPGTGVGLAIVQRVVARHGGRAWAEGRPGEGACFYFSLPKES